MSDNQDEIHIRKPNASDGLEIHQLIANSPPLDLNSVYSYYLLSDHFSDSCVVAESQGRVVGFLSAYRLPQRPETLFVWQVAVGETARGNGLAGQMLAHLLERPKCQHVRWLETTITESNQGSWALFRSMASKFGAELTSSMLFDRHTHFDDAHESELLVRIGPLGS